MKSEQRKKEDRELIERFLEKTSTVMRYADSGRKKFIIDSMLLDDFIKSENLEAKPKLELNRWIVDSNNPEWMWFYSEGEQYGISDCGRWRKSYFTGIKPMSLPTERYATDEEILERLSKIAVEMGYKERQSECLVFPKVPNNVDLRNSIFELDSRGKLWISSGEQYDLNCIFSNGKWAKFIETDTERIERLEKRVKELENKNK